ncbi:EamA-like transporter family protein [bacterium]|nr:EamA-like transporter family protein [bacterium]
MSGGTLAGYIACAALAGALIPVLAALNGTLGRSIGSPLHAAQISVIVAALGVAASMILLRPTTPAASAFAGAPPIAYFGGLAMGFYAVSAAWLAPRFGVGNLVICVVGAQLVMSACIDQFGLFGAPVHPVDLKRAAGLALVAAGAVLAMWR